jgi:hypothetical protein
MLTETITAKTLTEYDTEITQRLHNPSRSEKIQQWIRYGFSTSLGALSAWYAFGKTANDGAKFIPIPIFTLDLSTRRIISFFGGAVLNGILNSYFANKVIEKISLKKVNENKLKYVVVSLTALLSTLPFIATAEMTGEPWFAEVIEALAYSFIHFEGAEFLVDRSIEAIALLKTHCSRNHINEHYSLIDDTNETAEIMKFIEQAHSATLLDYCKEKRIPEKLPADKNSFSSFIDFYQSTHVPTREQNHKIQRLKTLLIVLNTLSMSCALLGYYRMSAEKTEDSLGLNKNSEWNTPIEILAFTPFAGIVLKVIFAVSQNLAESHYSHQAENYYFNNRMAQISFGISCVALAIIGWFSCATSLLLNNKYFGDEKWYQSIANIITIPAAGATALFNTYPTVILLSQHLIKPVVGLFDKNIARLNQFDATTERLKGMVYHADKSLINTIHSHLKKNTEIGQKEVKTEEPQNDTAIDITSSILLK